MEKRGSYFKLEECKLFIDARGKGLFHEEMAFISFNPLFGMPHFYSHGVELMQ
jgi:hypothetical protein